MSYLLDTNVISELVKPKPNQKVVAWVESLPQDKLHLSVLSLGEIRKGIESLPTGKKRSQLVTWLENTLPEWFEGRLLDINEDVADRWGYLTATAGRTLPAIDGLLAATAQTYNLKLVTRNVDDFNLPGLEVINPWE